MATINSVQKSIHLPLTGLTSPRVLMCSASVGTEGSVTLQLRDANSSDSNQSTTATTTTSLDNALTIGYPDPEMLADVLGTLQTASLKNNNNHTTTTTNITATTAAATSPSGANHSSNTNTNNNNSNNNNNNNKVTISRRNTNAANSNSNNKDSNKITVQTVSTSTNTTNKTNSYIKNCLIRSSPHSSTSAPNVTSLAQIMSNSSNSIINNTTNSNSNCSSNSNFSSSSSSNDSTISITSSSNNSSSGKNNYHQKNAASAGNQQHSGGAATVAKKSRPKLSSPTRHGPQQCQICSKIFGNASALAKHKLTHSDERKYVCAMCSKAFKRQDHLNGHMMTHRNKKPYECKAEGCGKSYCDARSLRRHTENHHAGIITPQNQTLSPTTTTAGTPTGLSLSPATASGDASSPDGATCIRTYISTGGSIVDAATGVALTEEQIKAINLPIKTGVTLLSPNTSSGGGSSSSASAASPTIALTETSNFEGEGLTREQLDLISKIMQQTKQTTAQVTVSSPTSVSSYKVDTGGGISVSGGGGNVGNASPQNSVTTRPRTWNMQLLNSSQNVSITVDEPITVDANFNTNIATSTTTASSSIECKDDDLNQQLVTAINPQLLNIVKIDQKPVECNLCHRKFKNIPALNGHMRLHGGYFKKDPETKKSEKKEPSGPPLQTASIGVRALIEEKIISKRSKDLNKGAFVVPAPPGSIASVNSSTSATIRRSLSDLESFLSPKSHSNSNGSNNNNSNSSISTTTNTTTMLPAATTIKSGMGNLSIQQIGLPQSIEIFSTKQQQQQQQQLKTVNNVSVGVGTNTTPITLLQANATISPSPSTMMMMMKSSATINATTTTKSTSTDPKDSTLIELLKRGTRIAVTAAGKKPQMQLNSTNNVTTTTATTLATSRQFITNNSRTVIIPSDVQVVSTKVSNKSNIGENSSRASTPGSITLADGSPLSLTIAQGIDGTHNAKDFNEAIDVYTVTYSGDAAGLFDDAEVYNVADTEMLLQTVDTMQLLNDEDEDAGEQIKREHSKQFTLNTSGSIIMDDVGIQNDIIKIETESNVREESSNMSSTLSTTALPTFQQFHSKELLLQNSSQLQAAISGMRCTNSLTLPVDLKQLASMTSPMNSPLAYPTPPSSHENITQSSSPYIEEGGQQFTTDSVNAFFGEKCQTDFLTQSANEAAAITFFKSENYALSDNEKILKLKNVLEESAFDASIKVEDLLNSSQNDTECDLREFAETNLSFLDEDQEFLNDSRNATSPLSESFFTSGIGSAEEVKEVLREVLPEENMNLNCDNQNENIIDLYYLPGLGLQSQMMPNSEDPLLSSSPRDFGQQRMQPQHLIQLPQQVQLQQQSLYTQQHMELQQNQQEQQQQQNQLKLNLSTAQTDFASNQIILSSSNLSTNAQLQYNVQNHLSQVQTTNPQIQLQQQHQQQQFMESTSIQQNINNIDGAILQTPIIYTGSTDREEININTQPQNNVQLLTNADVVTENENTIEEVSSNITANNIYFNSNPTTLLPSSKQLINNTTATLSPVAQATVISTLQPLSNQTNSILKRRLRANGPNSDANMSHTYSKYHALAPFRSKLRKTSRTHYTPAPMINPDRKGVGLYCNIRKALSTNLLTFDPFDDDFDDPVGLVDFSDESKVNLGSTYQAQIPTLCKERNNVLDTVGADKMWDPSVQTNEKILMRFIDLSKSSAVPLGSHSEEVALQTLFNAEGNTASAVLTLLQTQSNSFQMKWSAYELELFLRGLEKHGKDFSRLALELGTKGTGECVQMYYFWKKLCVDYKISHLKVENPSTATNTNSATSITTTQSVDPKPYVCEVPDCSASFTSKAALHGHTRIHTYGRNTNNNSHNNSNNNSNSNQHVTNNNNTTNTNNNNHNSSNNNSNNNNQNHNNNSNNNNNNTATTTTIITATNACAIQTGNSTNNNSSNNVNAANTTTNANKETGKDNISDYPCKVCGKVFSKVKSRSAHMKTHRVQEPDTSAQNQAHSQQQQQLLTAQSKQQQQQQQQQQQHQTTV